MYDIVEHGSAPSAEQGDLALAEQRDPRQQLRDGRCGATRGGVLDSAAAHRQTGIPDKVPAF